jgi:hypothetical protein
VARWTAFLVVVAACAAAPCTPVLAQERAYAAMFGTGSGLSVGTGADAAVVRHTPVFVDAGALTWSTEDTLVRAGATVRIEVDGRVGVGIVPRIELGKRLAEALSVRVGVTAPVFLAPYTMFGIEGVAGAVMHLGPTLGLSLTLLADAYFLGDDLPQRSAVFMLNGALGVELYL